MRTRLTAKENKVSNAFRPFPAMVFLVLVLLGLPHAAETGFAQTAQAVGGVPDFSGYWMRPEGGNGRMFYPPENGPGPLVNMDQTQEFTIGDDTNPILLPRAAEAVKAFGDQGRAGNVIFPAWSLCWPPAVPLILNMAEPLQLLQDDEHVTIIYQRGMQFRKIYLNEKHPDEIALSWYGHSIGHYEGGDTLVVDTIGQDTRSLVDRFGSPKSEDLRVVERYTVSDDGQTLTVNFEVEDPKTFATPWSARVAYVHPSARPGYVPGGFNRDGEAIQETVCAENNRDAQGGLFPIPTAEAPDF